MSAAQLADKIKTKQLQREKERLERKELEEREEAMLMERMRQAEEQEALRCTELMRQAEERWLKEERKKAKEEADVARMLQGTWRVISLEDKLTQLVENQMDVEEW
jgi:hypothetical protein